MGIINSEYGNNSVELKMFGHSIKFERGISVAQ